MRIPAFSRPKGRKASHRPPKRSFRDWFYEEIIMGYMRLYYALTRPAVVSARVLDCAARDFRRRLQSRPQTPTLDGSNSANYSDFDYSVCIIPGTSTTWSSATTTYIDTFIKSATGATQYSFRDKYESTMTPSTLLNNEPTPTNVITSILIPSSTISVAASGSTTSTVPLGHATEADSTFTTIITSMWAFLAAIFAAIYKMVSTIQPALLYLLKTPLESILDLREEIEESFMLQTIFAIFTIALIVFLIIFCLYPEDALRECFNFFRSDDGDGHERNRIVASSTTTSFQKGGQDDPAIRRADAEQPTAEPADDASTESVSGALVTINLPTVATPTHKSNGKGLNVLRVRLDELENAPKEQVSEDQGHLQESKMDIIKQKVDQIGDTWKKQAQAMTAQNEAIEAINATIKKIKDRGHPDQVLFDDIVAYGDRFYQETGTRYGEFEVKIGNAEAKYLEETAKRKADNQEQVKRVVDALDRQVAGFKRDMKSEVSDRVAESVTKYTNATIEAKVRESEGLQTKEIIESFLDSLREDRAAAKATTEYLTQLVQDLLDKQSKLQRRLDALGATPSPTASLGNVADSTTHASNSSLASSPLRLGPQSPSGRPATLKLQQQNQPSVSEGPAVQPSSTGETSLADSNPPTSDLKSPGRVHDKVSQIEKRAAEESSTSGTLTEASKAAKPPYTEKATRVESPQVSGSAVSQTFKKTHSRPQNSKPRSFSRSDARKVAIESKFIVAKSAQRSGAPVSSKPNEEALRNDDTPTHTEPPKQNPTISTPNLDSMPVGNPSTPEIVDDFDELAQKLGPIGVRTCLAQPKQSKQSLINDVDNGPICPVCKKQALRRCSNCKQIAYCSRKCQSKHWSLHKNDCKRLSSDEDKTEHNEGRDPDSDGGSGAMDIHETGKPNSKAKAVGGISTPDTLDHTYTATYNEQALSHADVDQNAQSPDPKSQILKGASAPGAVENTATVDLDAQTSTQPAGDQELKFPNQSSHHSESTREPVVAPILPGLLTSPEFASRLLEPNLFFLASARRNAKSGNKSRDSKERRSKSAPAAPPTSPLFVTAAPSPSGLPQVAFSGDRFGVKDIKFNPFAPGYHSRNVEQTSTAGSSFAPIQVRQPPATVDRSILALPNHHSEAKHNADVPMADAIAPLQQPEPLSMPTSVQDPAKAEENTDMNGIQPTTQLAQHQVTALTESSDDIIEDMELSDSTYAPTPTATSQTMLLHLHHSTLPQTRLGGSLLELKKSSRFDRKPEKKRKKAKGRDDSDETSPPHRVDTPVSSGVRPTTAGILEHQSSQDDSLEHQQVKDDPARWFQEGFADGPGVEDVSLDNYEENPHAEPARERGTLDPVAKWSSNEASNGIFHDTDNFTPSIIVAQSSGAITFPGDDEVSEIDFGGGGEYEPEFMRRSTAGANDTISDAILWHELPKKQEECVNYLQEAVGGALKAAVESKDEAHPGERLAQSSSFVGQVLRKISTQLGNPQNTDEAGKAGWKLLADVQNASQEQWARIVREFRTTGTVAVAMPDAKTTMTPGVTLPGSRTAAPRATFDHPAPMPSQNQSAFALAFGPQNGFRGTPDTSAGSAIRFGEQGHGSASVSEPPMENDTEMQDDGPSYMETRVREVSGERIRQWVRGQNHRHSNLIVLNEDEMEHMAMFIVVGIAMEPGLSDDAEDICGATSAHFEDMETRMEDEDSDLGFDWVEQALIIRGHQQSEEVTTDAAMPAVAQNAEPAAPVQDSSFPATPSFEAKFSFQPGTSFQAAASQGTTFQSSRPSASYASQNTSGASIANPVQRNEHAKEETRASKIKNYWHGRIIANIRKANTEHGLNLSEEDIDTMTRKLLAAIAVRVQREVSTGRRDEVAIISEGNKLIKVMEAGEKGYWTAGEVHDRPMNQGLVQRLLNRF